MVGFFFFHGKKSSESLLWKYLGLARLLQTTVPFTKANSGKVLKFHSDHFLHHFLMGLSYSCHHPKWRTDPCLLKGGAGLSSSPCWSAVGSPVLEVPTAHGKWCTHVAPTEVLLQTDKMCMRVSHPRGMRGTPLCSRFIAELLPTPHPPVGVGWGHACYWVPKWRKT